jgi:hypothetical protein
MQVVLPAGSTVFSEASYFKSSAAGSLARAPLQARL